VLNRQSEVSTLVRSREREEYHNGSRGKLLSCCDCDLNELRVHLLPPRRRHHRDHDCTLYPLRERVRFQVLNASGSRRENAMNENDPELEKRVNERVSKE
jgi:hypothetical protein